MSDAEEMFKEAFGMFDGGPTLGDLTQKVSSDPGLDHMARQQVLQQLRSETRNASPNTPLKGMLPQLGGGVLGYLIAKYFSMGPVGMAVSTMAGFGIGKTVSNFFKATNSYLNGNQAQVQRWGN